MRKTRLVTTSYHLPYNSKLVNRARELRKRMTPAEKKLWFNCLRDFNCRVLRQRPIDNYIVDSYCPRLRLIIEIDGEAHFTEEGKANDTHRTGILEAYGLKTIRFTNREVMGNQESVCEQISALAESPRPPSPALQSTQCGASVTRGADESLGVPPFERGARGDSDL